MLVAALARPLCRPGVISMASTIQPALSVACGAARCRARGRLQAHYNMRCGSATSTGLCSKALAISSAGGGPLRQPAQRGLLQQERRGRGHRACGRARVWRRHEAAAAGQFSSQNVCLCCQTHPQILHRAHKSNEDVYGELSCTPAWCGLIVRLSLQGLQHAVHLLSHALEASAARRMKFVRVPGNIPYRQWRQLLL